jgi:toxin FitB
VTALQTADTSVVVPALAEWHEHHEQAREAIAGVDQLPGQVLAETHSVLTRLPQGLALTPAMALTLLRGVFPGSPLTLDPAEYWTLLERVASAGLRGGAVYDSLVGLAAAAAGAELLTRDARAAEAYRCVGVRFRLVL